MRDTDPTAPDSITEAYNRLKNAQDDYARLPDMMKQEMAKEQERRETARAMRRKMPKVY